MSVLRQPASAVRRAGQNSGTLAESQIPTSGDLPFFESLGLIFATGWLWPGYRHLHALARARPAHEA
jgi:hypothetical protein